MLSYDEWAKKARDPNRDDEKRKRIERFKERESFLEEHPEFFSHTFSLMSVVLRCANSGLNLANYFDHKAYNHIYGDKNNSSGCDVCKKRFEIEKEADERFIN